MKIGLIFPAKLHHLDLGSGPRFQVENPRVRDRGPLPSPILTVQALQIFFEDCILEITFEDQVQKFTDFFEDCIFKIFFEDQAQKFTDFFEDCILKITFEDQLQKSTDFFF